MNTQQTYISEYMKFRPGNGVYNESTSNATMTLNFETSAADRPIFGFLIEIK